MHTETQSIIAGLIFVAGVALGWYLFSPEDSHGGSVSVKAVHGETARVTGTKIDSSGATLRTEYDGAGASDISVPARTMPQAAAWMDKHFGLSCAYSLQSCLYPLVSYRYESVNLFTGARIPVKNIASVKDYDLFAGVGVWF